MPLRITPGMSRVFVAVDLTPDVRAQLDAIQRRLIERALPLHVLDVDELHLTLAFIGDVVPSQIPTIAECVDATCSLKPPFELQFAGLGVSPDRALPDTFWAAVVQESPGRSALISLREELVANLQAAGFAADPSRIPHITLARLHPNAPRAGRERVVQSVAELQDYPPIPLLASEISVQSTKNRPGGVAYQRHTLVRLQSAES